MFKPNPQNSFENKTGLTDTLTANFETKQHSSERYNVSEMDSQTGGNNKQYEVTLEVVDRVNEIKAVEDIANFASSVTSARSSTRTLTHSY